jgi:DNA polymerase III subunit gamma/tau
MSAALHLAYRPKTLEDLVGQPYIKVTLTNAITNRQIAPAYLFTGPRGTGKTSTARIFAKSLNCLESKKPTVNPCGQCQSCRSIESSNSLDVSEIDAASHNGVDDARELVERSSFAPVAGRYRIFILDEVHCLSNQAFNALLKCIEEPPAHVVFVLCTTEAHKVLPTITSRTQRFEFRALSTGTITTQLRKVADTEEIAIGDDALSAIARIVNGGLRDALQLLSQVRLLGEGVTANQVIEMAGGTTESELLAIVEAIAARDTLQLLQSARELVDAGKTPTLILNSLLQTFRDLLVLQSAPKEQSLLTGVVSYRQLKSLAAKWSFDTLNLVLAQLHKAELQLRQSINAGVWLEVCLLNLISATQQEQEPIFPKLTTTTAEPTLNQIWHSAIDTAKSNNRMLLSKATLVKLNGSKATLEVAPTYLEKFEANKEAIARLLQRVTQHPKSITVFVRTAANANGRSNRRLSA